MSSNSAISVEAVVQAYRVACGMLLSLASTDVVNAEVLGSEVKRIGSQCVSHLHVMEVGLLPDSAVARAAEATLRSNREEELILDARFEQLHIEVIQLVNRARRFIAREQSAVALAGGSCVSAQRAIALSDGTTAAIELLHQRIFAATDAVAAAVDNLRALVRHQESS